MERPLSGRDEFWEWQERLRRFEASGLSIDAFPKHIHWRSRTCDGRDLPLFVR